MKQWDLQLRQGHGVLKLLFHEAEYAKELTVFKLFIQAPSLNCREPASMARVFQKSQLLNRIIHPGRAILYYFDNASLAYRIPLAVHIIFRCRGLVVGWLVSNKRYVIFETPVIFTAHLLQCQAFLAHFSLEIMIYSSANHVCNNSG